MPGAETSRRFAPLTKKQRREILQMAKNGETVRATAEALGISPTTVQKWRSRKSVGAKPAARRKLDLDQELVFEVLRLRKKKKSLAEIVKWLEKKKRVMTSTSSLRRLLIREFEKGYRFYPWDKGGPKRFRRTPVGPALTIPSWKPRRVQKS
jgi:IS30 family transposase